MKKSILTMLFVFFLFSIAISQDASEEKKKRIYVDGVYMTLIETPGYYKETSFNDTYWNFDSDWKWGIIYIPDGKQIKNLAFRYNLTRDRFEAHKDYDEAIYIVNPDSIENDRPYAAYLLATNYSVLINPSKYLKIYNEIGIGIMGPAAGGRQVQTFVHTVIGSSLPNGWEFQLRNAFLIDYQFRIEKGFFNDWIARHFIPFAKIRVGTLTDRIGIGLMTKFGNTYKSLGEVADGKNLHKRFIWEWVFEANLHGVFYDATLQGGLFNGNEVIKLKKQDTISRQYQLRMGVNLYYRSFYVRYMVKFNSQNFSSGVIHRYGGVNIGVSF
jgi:hypothetical protein